MISRALEDKNIQYAYSSIHDFFDSFCLGSSLHITESMLKAAISHECWQKSAPSRLLFLKEKLEELCSAALTIHYSNAIRIEAILTGPRDPDMSVDQHFTGGFSTCTVWNSFPRSLTAKQYNDPYKAIKKFADYMTEQKWKQTLKDCTEYALSNNPVYELYPPYNILTIRLRLLQLIEACHLLNIRAGIKKTEPLPGKKKKKNK